MTDGIEELGKRFGLDWIEAGGELGSGYVDDDAGFAPDGEEYLPTEDFTDLALKFGLELLDEEAEPLREEADGGDSADLFDLPPASPAYASTQTAFESGLSSSVRTWDVDAEELHVRLASLLQKYIDKRQMGEMLEHLPGERPVDVAQAIVDALSSASGPRLRDQPPSAVAEFVARKSEVVNQMFDRGDSVEIIAERTGTTPQVVSWSLVVSDQERQRISERLKATVQRRAAIAPW